MPIESADRLEELIHKIPKLLNRLTEEELDHSPASGKWSKKEILGHLIDSATNNHHRFVRLQFENEPPIFYDQDRWNRYNYYRTTTSQALVNFWSVYNRHLVHLMRHIPADNYPNVCILKNGERVTLEFLMKDYVCHQEHHLQQIVKYDF